MTEREHDDAVDRDQLLDHEYDGIKEYDNPLPRWWVGIFWATIVFSIVYFLYYQVGPGPTVVDEYNAGMLELSEKQAAEILKMGPPSDESIVRLAKDTTMMAGAAALYQAKCSPCHGAKGQGVIGPNLTDDHWIHGGRPVQIYTIIAEGVPAKGMLTWKTQLRPMELLTLAAYVDTLPATPGKAPEGQKFDPAAPAPAAPAVPPAPAPAAPAPGAAPGEQPKPEPAPMMDRVARPEPV